MKILHLSFGDLNGAFYGAYRTHANLVRYGHESTMFVLRKTSNDVNVVSVSNFYHVILDFFYRAVRRLVIKNDRLKDKTFLLYKTSFVLKKIFKIYKSSPDLIIIYYVAGFLSDNDIEKLQKHYGCPIAFYLMDVAALTGGCHYPWDCKGYMESCNQCPAVRNMFRAIPKNVFENRRRISSNVKSLFLSGSEWLDERIARSEIKPSFGSFKLLMGIDESIFSPRPKEEAMSVLNISIQRGNKVILLGAQSLSDTRKGFKYFIDAMHIIKKSNLELFSDVTFLTVGCSDYDCDAFNGFSHVNLPFIKDKNKYPYIYNLADVFICPSVEDAGPMMINEAIISGLPVISFRVGVASDLIINGYTGFISNEISSKALSKMLVKFVSLTLDDLHTMKTNARNYGMEKTSAEKQIVSLTKIINDFY